jgi:hypothetical protein
MSHISTDSSSVSLGLEPIFGARGHMFASLHFCILSAVGCPP